MDIIATRRERVVLELETNVPLEAAKAAAALRLLNEEFQHLGGRTSNRSPVRTVAQDIESVGRNADKSGPSIDKFSGRVGLLAKAAAALGPGLIPIGAVGIPAVAGLASQMGFAALGAGTMVAAFQGVGNALKAVNKAGLQPTTQNIAAARLAMQQISPDARNFVREIQRLEPSLKALRDQAAGGIFPGLTQGLDAMLSRLPDVQRIIGAVSGELGDIAASAGKGLAGSRWDDFFKFLAAEAPQALSDMAAATGNVAHALAELWMAFAPLNHGFSAMLVDATSNLDKWASGLAKTQGFQEFVDYIQKSGPQVAATMGAIANAVLQIVEAAAPLGGPVLRAIEGLANAVSAIANSDIGTPLFSMVAALSALNMAMSASTSVRRNFTAGQSQLLGGFNKQRASLRGLMADWRAYTAVTQSAQGRAQATSTQMIAQREAAAKLGTSLRETALAASKAGALVGAMALETTGLGDKMGATNTIALSMAGWMVGPWGAAIGAGVGATLDLAHANDDLRSSVTAARAAMRVGDITAMSAAYDHLAAKIRETGTLNTNPLSVTPTAGADRLKLAAGYLTGATQKAKKEAADLEGAINGVAAASTGQELVRGFGFMGKGFSMTAVGARQASAALRANRAAASETAHQFITLGKSLNNAKVDLNGWIRQMARQADALNNFAANAQRAANRGLRQGLIKALQQAGPEGALRMRQLANATDTQIARANQAWARGQRAARNYTSAVGSGAQTAKQKIAAMRAEIARLKDKTVHLNEQGAAAARARIAALRAQIAALHDKYVTVHVNVSRSGRNLGGGAGTIGATTGADGMTVPGPRYPYADKVFAYLAPGEEVITNRNGEADQFRADRAAGRIPHYAVGGKVQRLAGGGAARHHDNNAHHVNLFADALKRATASLDKEKAARDALISKRNDLTGSVRDHFLSDPFGGGSAWSAGGGSPIAVMKADIAKARAFSAQLARLKSEGLRGDALAAIASTGDIGKAAALAATGKAGVGQYASAFAQRAAAANAVGVYAGNAAYGAAIVRDNTQLVTLNATVHRLEAQMKHRHGENKKANRANAHAAGQATGKAINHAASSAHKKSRRG